MIKQKFDIWILKFDIFKRMRYLTVIYPSYSGLQLKEAAKLIRGVYTQTNRSFLSIVFSIFLVLAFTQPILAASRRILPGKRVVRTSYATVGTTVRFRSDRRAVIVNFSRLNLANSVSYVLTYNANGKSEGSQGVIRPAGEIATSRELLFGTCSTNVCTYHTNITNARLTITIALKSGKTIRRTYKLKV